MATSPRKPRTDGFHTDETLHLRSKPADAENTHIITEGTADDVNMHLNPKGDGQIIHDKESTFDDEVFFNDKATSVGENNTFEIEGTLHVDTIEERISGCNEGITIEGVTFKDGKIVSQEIETYDWTTVTQSTEVDTTDRIFTLNSGETGSGMSDTDRIAGFRVDRGNMYDFLFVYDDTDNYMKVGWWCEDDTFAFDRDCAYLRKVHASETITDMQVPFAADSISGTHYEETPDFTFDYNTKTLNVNGEITMFDSVVALHSTLVAVSGDLQDQIDDTNALLVAVSGDLQDQIDDTNTLLVAVSSDLQTQLDDTNTLLVAVSSDLQYQLDDTNTLLVAVSSDLQDQLNDTNTLLVAVSSEIQEDLDAVNTDLQEQLDDTNALLVSTSGNLQDNLDAVEADLQNQLDDTNTLLVETSGNLQDNLDAVEADLQNQLDDTNTLLVETSGNLQDNLDAVEADLQNQLDDTNTLLVETSGNLQDNLDAVEADLQNQIDALDTSSGSSLASLSAELDSVEADLQNQIDGNDIDITLLNSTLVAVSGFLGSNIEELQTNTYGITGGITQIDDAYMTETEIASQYATKTELASVSGNLEDQIALIDPNTIDWSLLPTSEPISGSYTMWNDGGLVKIKT